MWLWCVCWFGVVGVVCLVGGCVLVCVVSIVVCVFWCLLFRWGCCRVGVVFGLFLF